MGLEKNGNILVQISNYQCTIPVHFHVLIFLFNSIFQHAGKNSIRFKDTVISFIFLSINFVDFVMNTILKILKHMSLPKQMVGLILDSFILGIYFAQQRNSQILGPKHYNETTVKIFLWYPCNKGIACTL